MDMNTWAGIEATFGKWPESKASPVAAAEFDEVMRPFGYIDRDYRDFVLRYGGGIVGSRPIYGLRKASWMGTIDGNGTAPEITQRFREIKWVGVEDWLIFSVDQGGNPLGFAKDGAVWLSDQLDFGQIVQLASGFEDYLLKWCLKLRPVE